MKHVLYSGLILVSLAGCSSLDTGLNADSRLVQVDDILTGAPQTLPAVMELNGKPALLYASKDNRITFQYGDQRQKLDATAPVTGGTTYQLHAADEKLLAMWWSHQDGKNLYASLSGDQGKSFASTGIVNISNGVLPFYSVLRGPHDTLGVTYLDEREPGYVAFFNRSTDFGSTWGRPDQRLDATPATQRNSVQEPQAVQSGSAWIATWSDVERTADGIGYRIVIRRSEDAGQHWSDPVFIYRPQKFVSSLTMRALGDTIVIAGDELSRGVFALTSTDQGRSWKASGFVSGSDFKPGQDGTSNSGVDLALTEGRAHVVWMQDRAPKKTIVMRAALDTAQGTWLTEAQRLDPKEYEVTRSMVPTIMASKRGTIWTAWIDYRDIRPNVYLSYSLDAGATWSGPKSLLKAGEISAGFPRFYRWGDDVALGYEMYPTDRQTDGSFVLKKLTVREDGQSVPALFEASNMTDAERKAKLVQRVEALWKARIAGDYDFAYEVFDFAYRAAIPKRNYVENVGAITYQSYSVEDVTVTGPEATVKMKAKYEMKPTYLPSGKPIKLDPIEVELANTWVWVGNDWYLVYSPSFGQPHLKY
jgi:hypothetical protein